MVTSEESQFSLKAAGDTSTVCGMYIITDPDRRVEVHFEYLDVPCQNGGLVSVSGKFHFNEPKYLIQKINILILTQMF
jgi:hypothetical protein